MDGSLFKENHPKIYDKHLNRSLSACQKHNPCSENHISELIKEQLESLQNKIKKVNSKFYHLEIMNKINYHYCFALPLNDYIVPSYQEIEKWAKEIEKELSLANFVYQSEDMSKLLHDSSVEIKKYFAIYSNQCQEFLRKCIEIKTKFSQELEKEIEIYKSNVITLVNRKNNQTKVSFYNTEDQSFFCKLINTPELLSEYTCITQLPNNEIFCFGNNDPVSGVTCIINTNLLSYRTLIYGKSCYNSSAIYYNDFVYVFGGCDWYDLLSHAAKYDVSNNRWINLPQLPEPAELCSCIPFKQKILISGKNLSALYNFDPIIRSYSVVKYFFLDQYDTKVLFLLNSRLYLITQKNIYESALLDEFNWTCITDIYMCNYQQIFKVYGREGVYVGLNYTGINEGNFYHYYLFNMKDKSFNSVNLYKIH